MTELKTLKDFEEKHICDVDCCCREDLAEELMQEAIKWVKKDLETINSEIKRLRKTNTLTESGFKEECNEHLREEYARIEWIKHFFNITEEDLK